MPLNRHVFMQLFAPLKQIVQQHTELDGAKTKAKAIGAEREFEILWRAEKYRARNFPGACLTPDEILKITVATCGGV